MSQRIVISRDFLEEFFKILFFHVGYSQYYKRYVIVEPVCIVTCIDGRVASCKSVDFLVDNFYDIGSKAASVIDREHGDFIEQVFATYLEQKKNFILVGDNPIMFPYERIPKLLKFLENNANMIPIISGLVHYHVDEPQLNENDLKTLTEYSKRIAEAGGQSQLGIVVSEDDPSESVRTTLPRKEEQLKKYVELMISKCMVGEVKIAGAGFINDRLESLKIILET
ncbi:MAG: hypothetical protein QXR97_05955 [Thermoproteota archaeon]